MNLKSMISPSRIVSFLLTCAVVLGAGLLGAGHIPHAHGSDVRVVAVVNSQPITNLDIQERVVFLTGTTGITITDENRDRINQDVLQMLIDDLIKREEGLFLGRGFEQSAKNHAVELVNASFSQHGEDPDTVMQRLGINRKIAEEKFLTDVVWASAIQSRYADQFANIRTEAEQELERIRQNAFKPQVELDEIVLVPEPNRNFNQTMVVANQMYDAILKGADFGRIAQQYSATGSARNGGKLGWVPLERLNDEIRALVEAVPSGAIAKPIEIDGAVAIYRVNGIRRNGNADPLESTVTVARLVRPVAESDEASRAAAAAALNNEISTINDCTGLDLLHKKGGNTSPLIMGEFKLGEFALKLRSVLLPLDQGEKTEPLNFAEGLVVFMICEKITPELQLPSIDELEERIRNSHFSVIASRHLQRLRRNAVISIRDDA